MSRRKNRPVNGQLVLSKQERIAQRYRELARLRQIEHLTIEQCAGRLGVSPRTIATDLASEEWRQVIEAMREEWRQDAITTVGDLVQIALDTLKDVMLNDRSGHARYEAASKIMDAYGVVVTSKDESKSDDRLEMERLTQILAARPVVNVFNVPPEPGGFLPKQISGQTVESDYLPARLLSNMQQKEPPGQQ